MSRTIYDLLVWNKALIDTCQYCSTSRANQALHSLVNAGFQNWGVCLQAFPSFPFSSPLLHFLALISFLTRWKPRIPFLSLFLLQSQTETLFTQAIPYLKKVNPRNSSTFKRLFSKNMGKTPSSHIIHSLGGEYCWIVRDSKPVRLLKSQRSLSVFILIRLMWQVTL